MSAIAFSWFCAIVLFTVCLHLYQQHSRNWINLEIACTEFHPRNLHTIWIYQRAKLSMHQCLRIEVDLMINRIEPLSAWASSTCVSLYVCVDFFDEPETQTLPFIYVHLLWLNWWTCILTQRKHTRKTTSTSAFESQNTFTHAHA